MAKRHKYRPRQAVYPSSPHTRRKTMQTLRQIHAFLPAAPLPLPKGIRHLLRAICRFIRDDIPDWLFNK